jgi:hypothetical protein
MDTQTLIPPEAQEVERQWQALQNAAVRVARVRQQPHLEQLASKELGAWIEIQRKDLDEGTAALKGRAEAQAVVDNLTSRTEALEEQHRQAKGIHEGIAQVIKHLGAAKHARENDLHEDFARLSAAIEDSVAVIETSWAQMHSTIDPDKVTKTLASTSRGDRPIRQVLSKELSKVGSSSPTADQPQANPLPVEQRAAVPLGPGADKFRKSLGRSLSAIEIEHVSLEFFTTLWANEVDQSKVGEILFYQPQSCFGLSVHDMLGFAKGSETLRGVMQEFKVKFPIA